MVSLFSLEHSRTAYRIDFALYAVASAALGAALLLVSPPGRGPLLAGLALAGLGGWTLVEYGLHRFVLHGLPPFKHWHAEHHRRPGALISSPTLMSAGLFVLLAILPLWWLIGPWPTCALGFGLLTGYLGYGLAHHATHHPVPPGLRLGRSRWLRARRRAHALHHGPPGGPGVNYGVSVGVWDRVFRTLQVPADRM